MKIVKSTPDGFLLEDGTMAVCRYRNPTGKPEDLEAAFVGSDGVVYSPIFKSKDGKSALDQLTEWLKPKGIRFVPFGDGINPKTENN